MPEGVREGVAASLGEAPAVSRLELPGMSLLEHLEELRKRIFLSIIGIGAGFGACWWKRDAIYGYMQTPITSVLRAHKMSDKLVYLNPTEPFELYMKLALVAGLFLASPWVLFQVWMFISPGLYRHEKRYALPFILATVGLFLAGGAFAYYLVYPRALDFLIGFGSQFQPMVTITEYTSLFMAVVLGLGLVFEMPILIFFLAFFGIVSAAFLWKNLRYSILIIFIIAAVVTPTSDILNMCIFAAPMVVLYFVSMGLAYFAHPSYRRRKELKTA